VRLPEQTFDSPEAQAIAWFDVDGLNKAPARLDFAKLDSVNAHYMAQADDTRLAGLFLARPEAAGLSDVAKARVIAAMPHLKTRAATIAALAEASRFLGDLRPIRLEGKAAAQMTPEGKARLAAIAARLEGLGDFSERAIKEDLAEYCAAESIGLGKVGPLLRAALTGGAPSPDITLVMALLGRGESLARLRDQAE
jgi:glutamyl-tRNA synthetase